ncbi:MAG: hypothetical protein AB7T49_05380 [Oligoflexales bacterium]
MFSAFFRLVVVLGAWLAPAPLCFAQVHSFLSLDMGRGETRSHGANDGTYKTTYGNLTLAGKLFQYPAYMGLIFETSKTDGLTHLPDDVAIDTDKAYNNMDGLGLKWGLIKWRMVSELSATGGRIRNVIPDYRSSTYVYRAGSLSLGYLIYRSRFSAFNVNLVGQKVAPDQDWQVAHGANELDQVLITFCLKLFSL